MQRSMLGGIGRKRKRCLKVLLIGNSAVGKTSLMQFFCHGVFEKQYKATVGADFGTREVRIDDSNVTLQLWDTAGQERFQSLGWAFYRGSDACVLVCSVDDYTTFESLDHWREEFLCHANSSTGLSSFPFILLVNKSDKIHLRTVPEAAIKAWCSTNSFSGEPIPYFETSAKQGTNVEAAFLHTARLALRHHNESLMAEDQTLGNYSGIVKLRSNSEDTMSKSSKLGQERREGNCC